MFSRRMKNDNSSVELAKAAVIIPTAAFAVLFIAPVNCNVELFISTAIEKLTP